MDGRKLEWEDQMGKRREDGLGTEYREGQLKLKAIGGVVWKHNTEEASKNIYIYEGYLNGL